MTSTAPNPLPPDESVGPHLLVLTCTLTAISILTTGLRLWVRWARHRLGWDDFTIFITTLLAIARMAIQIVQVHHGNGRHRWYLAVDEYKYINKLGLIAQMLLFITICLLKISICLLILRIKDTRPLRLLMYVVISSLVITNGGCFVILLAECNPMKKYWDDSAPGKCWPPKVRIYSIYLTISVSILTDLICSLLPLVVVWKIRISIQKKIAVCGLMSLGLLATGFAIVRASSLGLKTSDLSYSYCIAAIWSNLELFLGIIAANLALGRSMVVFIRDGAQTMSSQNRSHSNGLNSSGFMEQSNNTGKGQPPPNQQRRRNSLAKSEDSDIPLEPYQKSLDRYQQHSDEERGLDQSHNQNQNHRMQSYGIYKKVEVSVV